MKIPLTTYGQLNKWKHILSHILKIHFSTQTYNLCEASTDAVLQPTTADLPLFRSVAIIVGYILRCRRHTHLDIMALWIVEVEIANCVKYMQ